MPPPGIKGAGRRPERKHLGSLSAEPVRVADAAGLRFDLNKLSEDFDLIIIDSPPTLAVTDPVVIGRYVGGSILTSSTP